ncbi:MAG TPA: NADH-quinone oxidoreductase subunit M, partial [Povalibacter sp.]
LGAAGVAAFSRGTGEAARAVAMIAMLIVLITALRIFLAYDATTDAAHFELDVPWMPSLGIRFHVGVDGFNIYLLLVAAVLFPVALAASWTAAVSRRPLYLALLLILQMSLLGTFLAQNLVLFFVCWETVLIPMGILILVFGGRERYRAAMTFFMYTLAGSILLLAAVITLGAEALHQTGHWSFELNVLYGLELDRSLQMFVFVAIVLACLVKCPLAPFHSWLIPAYYEAPPVASALMSGAMSKMGALGLLKLAVPLAPDVAVELAPYLVALAVINIVYGALLALREKSYKKIIAYASLSHMGYIVLGIFTFEHTSIQGSMLQMLSHAMVTPGLFLILGILEQQRGPAYASTNALASSAPRLAVMFTAFVLVSVAVPLTSGFVAEFLILFGAFVHGLATWRAADGAQLLVLAVIASLGMVLGAAYMLRFTRSILFGKADPTATVHDLRLREAASLAVPLLLAFWIGIAPASIIAKTRGVVSDLSAESKRACSNSHHVGCAAIADAGEAHGD